MLAITLDMPSRRGLTEGLALPPLHAAAAARYAMPSARHYYTTLHADIMLRRFTEQRRHMRRYARRLDTLLMRICRAGLHHAMRCFITPLRCAMLPDTTKFATRPCLFVIC